MSRKSHSKSKRPKVKTTPLPKKLMTALALVLMTESVASTMLFPFVGLFVAYLQNYTKEEAGYASGILIGVFQLGQMASLKLWGYISDTYGRKLPLNLGLVASGISIMFFGLSKNFVIATIWRFLHGFCNGNVLVAKTIIADVTDRTNEARGFSLVSLTWSVGTLIGPFIGGFLYDPVNNEKLSWLHLRKDNFLAAYPAFLPCFCIFIYSIFAIFICFVFIHDTNPNRKRLSELKPIRYLLNLVGMHKELNNNSNNDTNNPVVITNALDEEKLDDNNNNIDNNNNNIIHEKSGYCNNEEISNKKQVELCADKLQDNNNNNNNDNNSNSDFNNSKQTLPTSTKKPGKSSRPKRAQLTYLEAIKLGPLRNITIFYMLISACDIAYGGVFPLWGIASHESGGLDLPVDEVAILVLANSIPAVIANMLFQWICRKMNNYITLWRMSITSLIFFTLIIPFGVEMGSFGFWYVMLVGILRQVGLAWGFSMIHMLTAKTAPPGCVGAAYGISQSFASAVRCVVPFVASPLFAWSISAHHIFPFNYFLLFILSVVPLAVSLWMSYYVRLTREESATDVVVTPQLSSTSTTNILHDENDTNEGEDESNVYGNQPSNDNNEQKKKKKQGKRKGKKSKKKSTDQGIRGGEASNMECHNNTNEESNNGTICSTLGNAIREFDATSKYESVEDHDPLHSNKEQQQFSHHREEQEEEQSEEEEDEEYSSSSEDVEYNRHSSCYASLATSFSVNPLIDTAIDMHRMERVNRGIDESDEETDSTSSDFGDPHCANCNINSSNHVNFHDDYNAEEMSSDVQSCISANDDGRSDMADAQVLFTSIQSQMREDQRVVQDEVVD